MYPSIWDVCLMRHLRLHTRWLEMCAIVLWLKTRMYLKRCRIFFYIHCAKLSTCSPELLGQLWTATQELSSWWISQTGSLPFGSCFEWSNVVEIHSIRLDVYSVKKVSIFYCPCWMVWLIIAKASIRTHCLVQPPLMKVSSDSTTPWPACCVVGWSPPGGCARSESVRPAWWSPPVRRARSESLSAPWAVLSCLVSMELIDLPFSHWSHVAAKTPSRMGRLVLDLIATSSHVTFSP